MLPNWLQIEDNKFLKINYLLMSNLFAQEMKLAWKSSSNYTLCCQAEFVYNWRKNNFDQSHNTCINLLNLLCTGLRNHEPVYNIY